MTCIAFPESVTRICGSAFYGCTNLKSAIIPDSVTTIDRGAFGNCGSVLTVYGFRGSEAENYCINNSVNFLTLYEYSDLGSNKLMITQCNFIDSLGSLSIPSSIGGKTVTQIGEWLIANNTKLKSVSIPDTVTKILRGAFYNCTELRTVRMGSRVTEIGESAFEKCLFLESINLSSGLKKIGDEAFYDCRRLKTLSIPDTVMSIGEEAFTNCRSLQSLVIPNGVKKLGDGTGFGIFENCKSLKAIKIPESVRFIQNNAFDGCLDVTVVGAKDSYAENYSAENHLRFSIMGSNPVGDTNLDGVVNIKDTTAIQRHISEHETLTGNALFLADTNRDGEITVADATLLQMYLAEYDVQFKTS